MKKPTNAQIYEKAVEIYEENAAVYQWAKDMGITRYTYCDACEADTPTINHHGATCLVCGSTVDTSVKAYEVPVTVAFTGTVKVRAKNITEARLMVERNFWATIGNIGENDSNILDWNMDTHCDSVLAKAKK